MKNVMATRELTAAVSAVLAITATVWAPSSASADEKKPGKYVTGDFHNHTTCSDGTLSLKKLVDKSTNTFGLDWFAQAGHGGNSARNCTLAEDPFEPVPPALGLTVPPTIPRSGQDRADGKGPNQTWVDTLPGGAARIKGTPVFQNGVLSMWKWQEIQEFIYPVIEQESRNRSKPIYVGLEQVVPGHEHTSSAIIDGQLPEFGTGNADAMAKFEYCFDRADNDLSRGANNQWDCSVPGSGNNGLVNPAAKKILVAGGVGSGTAGHIKTVEGVKWMAAYYPRTSYYIPAHLERAGAFNPNGNNGFNIEHLRDFNNAAPDVAFGFESMPGHQAEAQRGSYSPNAVGGGTYGGTGIYAAAIGGVWDALLGEGRRWFFFASSDYHNRGAFGPDQRESSADFFPGEYTKDHVAVRTTGSDDEGDRDEDRRAKKFGTRQIVDGLRSGNSFVANGGLIDRLSFVACVVEGKGKGRSEEGRAYNVNPQEQAIARAARRNETYSHPNCASMGEDLNVRAGDDVMVTVVLRDPVGTNNSPYSFPNPSLAQPGVGIIQPLNAPVLDHVDLIGGKITGKVDPSNTAAYAGLIGSPAASNPSAMLKATFNSANWTASTDGWRRMSFRINNIGSSQYVRLRGTNLPPATPYETDSKGNPLLDFGAAGKIPCTDVACPAHMVVVNGVKTSSLDVAAWADLWFYSNPIFIKLQSSANVASR